MSDKNVKGSAAPAEGRENAGHDWMDEARCIAAQCWCDDTTAHIVMDTALCEAVARRIAAWMQTGAQHARNESYWRERALATAPTMSEAVRDSQRLDWLIEQRAWVQWHERDGSIRQCQVWWQDEDENYHTLSGDHRYFNTPREAIDAAIDRAAAKEKP